MSTHSKTTSVTTRWAVPAVAVVAGLAYLVAGLLSDDPGVGIFGLAVMLGVGVVLMMAAGWSETVAGLRDRTDERINHIDSAASLTAGMTVLLVVWVMFVVEIAQSKDGFRTPSSAQWVA